MQEADVQAALIAHLQERGWLDIETSPRGVDVIAKRGAEVLKAEVKGVTSSPGLDVDTLFGQALRMMDDADSEMTSYAIVVPESLLPKIERVSAAVRRRLDLDVYLVDDFGGVRRLEE